MTVYEDELDLYPYILTLLKSWKLIFAIALLAGIGALVFSLLQPRIYSATATIIGTYQRPVLTLSQDFSTVSSDANVDKKHDAFLSIANSDAIAQTVFEQYTEELPSDMRLKDFKEQIEITDDGDAILITASFEDPALSAEIANTWANETVLAINTIYSGSQPLAPIQAQIIEAKTNYVAAQGALETFIEDNQIAGLERSIAESQQVLDNLQSIKLEIVDKYLNTQVGLITQQADQYFNTLSEHSKVVFSSQVDEQLKLFSYYAARKTNLETLLVQAEALKEQLSGGNSSVAGSTADALALFLFRAQTFGFNSNASTMNTVTTASESNTVSDPLTGSNLTLENNLSLADNLPIDVTLGELAALQDTSTNYVSDINTVIGQIESELVKTDDKLQELSRFLVSGGDYQYFESPDSENPLFVAGMESLNKLVEMDLPATLIPDDTGTALDNQMAESSAELQTLQAQLESETSAQRQLTNERDLAERAYQALLVKETEITAGSQSSSEVALASSAIVPTTPDSRGTIVNTVLAAVVGGMLAVAWVFVSSWWQSQSENRSGAETA